MPTFTARAEAIVSQLGKVKAFDRKSGVVLTSPTAAAPLVNAGVLAKATRKSPGGSQITIYWIASPLGQQQMLHGFAGRRCRFCNCTEFNACVGGCHWIAEDVCSASPCKKRYLAPSKVSRSGKRAR